MTTQTAERLPLNPLNYALAEPRIHPWLFVPTLYFMQAIPNVLVIETFGTAYKNLGIDNLQITLWTGLAALPWVFKMFWAPLVDLSSTKRKWTVAMQVLMSLAIAASALAMTTNLFFALTVGAMFLIATLSATHDIACDGLYLMSLDRRRQAAFSGVMATCSRMGRLFDVSVIIFLAGWFVNHKFGKQNAWALALGAAAIVYGLGMIWNFFFLPRPAADHPAVDVPPGERSANLIRTFTIIAFGVALYYFIDAVLQWIGYAIFLHVPPGKVPLLWDMPGTQKRNLLIQLIVCTLTLPPIWLLIRKQVRNTSMGDAFSTYFRQPGFPSIMAFIIFYRFGEAMIFAMSKLFFLDTPTHGGMGISLETLSAIQGIGQVGGLVIGGLAGGWFISRVGLRRAFWPLVVCMHVPNLLYIWMAHTHPSANWAYLVVFSEACGYGFGFAGYFVYLMQVAQRNHFVTSHYAIGTGLGALFITFATIFSGIVQQVFGYLGVFIAACLFTIPGTLTLLLIPQDNMNPPSPTPSPPTH